MCGGWGGGSRCLTKPLILSLRASVASHVVVAVKWVVSCTQITCVQPLSRCTQIVLASSFFSERFFHLYSSTMFFGCCLFVCFCFFVCLFFDGFFFLGGGVVCLFFWFFCFCFLGGGGGCMCVCVLFIGPFVPAC